jgi:zinc transport system ATP-binding protein
MRTVIQCEGVEVRYGPVTVLQGITFEVPERKTLCVVGPNGGGKSTLLKVLLGLVRPQAGQVRILGDDPRQSRHKVGYMPQYVQIDPLFPIDVEGIVRMGRLRSSGWGFYDKEDRTATQRALEEVGLWEQRREPFINLSGGMKQRVLIARALVNDPEILLLDEPTAMVDAHIEAKLLEHLKTLHNRMTILLVSHDAAFVSNLVDEVLCVNRTAEVHPVEKVEDKALEHLYGGPVQAVLHGDHCHGHAHGGEEGGDTEDE